MTCIQCSENEFAIAGSSKCSACNLQSTSAPGSTYCIAPAGKFWDLSINRASDCKNNTFSLEGSFGCKSCPVGVPSSPGRSNCYCKDGFVFNPESVKCEMCPAGKYARYKFGTCFLGPAGTFSPVAGSSSCTLCPEGSISSTNGTTSCTQCKANEFSVSNRTACGKCPARSDSVASNNSVCSCLDTQFFSTVSGQCILCSKNAKGTCDCQDGKKWSGKISKCV